MTNQANYWEARYYRAQDAFTELKNITKSIDAGLWTPEYRVLADRIHSLGRDVFYVDSEIVPDAPQSDQPAQGMFTGEELRKLCYTKCGLDPARMRDRWDALADTLTQRLGAPASQPVAPITLPDPRPYADRCVFSAKDEYDGDSIAARIVQALNEYGSVCIRSISPDPNWLARQIAEAKIAGHDECCRLPNCRTRTALESASDTLKTIAWVRTVPDATGFSLDEDIKSQGF